MRLLWLLLVLVFTSPALGDERIPALVEQLGSPEPGVSFAARTRLSEIGEDAFLPLLAVLQDEGRSPIHRRFAAEVLGNIGDESLLPHLERLLGDEGEDYQVRFGVLQGINRIGGEAGVAILRRIVREESDVDLRGSAARRLEDHAELFDVREDLFVAMEDGEVYVRRQASRAMETIDAWEEAHLVKLEELVFREEDEGIRAALVSTIARVPGERAEGVLERILKEDAADPVRGAAVRGITERNNGHASESGGSTFGEQPQPQPDGESSDQTESERAPTRGASAPSSAEGRTEAPVVVATGAAPSTADAESSRDWIRIAAGALGILLVVTFTWFGFLRE